MTGAGFLQKFGRTIFKIIHAHPHVTVLSLRHCAKQGDCESRLLIGRGAGCYFVETSVILVAKIDVVTTGLTVHFETDS